MVGSEESGGGVEEERSLNFENEEQKRGEAKRSDRQATAAKEQEKKATSKENFNHPRKLVSLLQRVVLVRKIGGLSNRDNNVPVPRNSPFRDGSGPFPLSRATSRLTRKSPNGAPCARLSRTDRARPLSQALPLPSEILLPDNG